MNATLLAPLLLPLLAAADAQDEHVPGRHVPPEVGAVAKPLETVYWYYQGPDGKVPPIASLRGEVVLVHTWGYYCGPCMKEGVPYVADLMKAHRAEGLHAYSVTVAIGDGQPDDHFVKVGRELGLEHPLGVADGFGEMTPYVNMNESKGLTWCFVIGREGGVRFNGDPSIDDEEFLTAVRDALLEEPLPPLAEQIPEPLAKAVRLYVGGELAKAADEAAKVRKKHEKKRADEEQAAVLAGATKLLEQIDGHRAALAERLEAAFEGRDAAAYVDARRWLVARFAKTDAAKRVKELDKLLKEDAAFEEAVERWSEWDELRRSAPALFPVRADRESERYAKELAKYVERAGEDAPGLAEARALLARFEGD